MSGADGIPVLHFSVQRNLTHRLPAQESVFLCKDVKLQRHYPFFKSCGFLAPFQVVNRSYLLILYIVYILPVQFYYILVFLNRKILNQDSFVNVTLLKHFFKCLN